MRARKLLGDYRQQKVSFAEQGADLIAMTFGQLIFPDWPLDVGTKLMYLSNASMFGSLF